MSILDWFAQRETQKVSRQKLDIPQDLWVKCFSCGDTLYLKELEDNNKVCLKCQYHFRISPDERLKYVFDGDSFEEHHALVSSVDPLKFTDTEPYKNRIEKAKKKTKRLDAIVIGTATIDGMPVNVGVMDFSFLGGSMGSVVGEKVARLVEMALVNEWPVVLFTSSGGARMQEGILSLMQMAKTSAALYRLGEAKIPYISVLCDPTTGGTSASFAMLGDLIFAEPGALISFAGPRVIEQTIRQTLPPEFQRSEFLLDHGMVDRVVHRKEMRTTLSLSLKLMGCRRYQEATVVG